MAFGLSLPGGQITLSILSILMTFVLIYFFWIERMSHFTIKLGLSLIIAGAFGNLVDRILAGKVVDFLHIKIGSYWEWYIFNIADTSVSIGMVFFIIHSIYFQEKISEKVMEITAGKGVTVAYDGVGKDTFKGSIACLKPRGMMASFGNASGPLDPVNVPKDIQSKSLFLTRPTIGHYFTNRDELQKGADEIFEKVKFGKIKIKIFKEYKLADAKQAHKDLESRRLLGPAILIP